MRAVFAAIIGAFLLLGLLIIIPLIREAGASLNTTANITQYEGLWQTVEMAPLIILLVFGVLIIFWIFGVRIRGKLPLGDGD